LPYLEESDEDERCAACRSGEFNVEPPDASLASATEAEVRIALAASWQFVGSDRTEAYLRRVLCDVAGRIPGVPSDGRVVLVREDSIRTLALPSGTVILSLGVLEALEDEAELAFVLAHELAHVAAGDAGDALVRIGLRDLVAAQHEDEAPDWSDAALDLIRLGHGDHAEHAADAVALAAIESLGYDTQGAIRYLQRIRQRTDRGDSEVAELALAHPPAVDRLKRVEGLQSLRARATHPGRVDREVFRRVAGHTVLASGLDPVRPFDQPTRGNRVVVRWGGSRSLWLLAGLLVLVLLAVLYGLL
jgi:predicted Zn-dependent protease